MSVANELIEVTGLERKEGEEEQQFYKRIAVAYGKMTDAEVNSLSEGAYTWSEAAMQAKNAGTLVPYLDGFLELDDEQEEEEVSQVSIPVVIDEPEYEPAIEVPESQQEEQEKSRKPVKDRKGRSSDHTFAFRELMLMNWGLARDHLLEKAKEKGIELSDGTINGIYYHTNQTIKLLTRLYDIRVPMVGRKVMPRERALDSKGNPKPIKEQK